MSTTSPRFGLAGLASSSLAVGVLTGRLWLRPPSSGAPVGLRFRFVVCLGRWLLRRLFSLRRFRFLRGGLRRLRRATVDREHHLADVDLLSLLDLHLFHRAGDRRGNFDGRLVGLELENRLVFGDRVPGLDQHPDDVARRDVLAELRES